jgi:hypothetical protein
LPQLGADVVEYLFVLLGQNDFDDVFSVQRVTIVWQNLKKESVGRFTLLPRSHRIRSLRNPLLLPCQTFSFLKPTNDNTAGL